MVNVFFGDEGGVLGTVLGGSVDIIVVEPCEGGVITEADFIITHVMRFPSS